MPRGTRLLRDVPPALPILSRGKHLSPADGACVMELVSVLAGEWWSDHPRCTHPALAELARVVNDILPDGEQARLAEHAPELVGLRPHDLRVTPALVGLCLGAQDAAGLGNPRQRRLARRAERRLDAISARRRRWWLIATEPVYRVCTARTAMADAALALARARPATAVDDLVDLLGRAIRLCSALEHPADEARAEPSALAERTGGGSLG